MKKLIALLLLVIFLFNIGGKLLLHCYFSYRSEKFFAEQTGKGLYNTGDLTEVKLPVDMPGIADWAAYENISGQVQFQDACYNYVKMKVTRNALYLMCVPNYSTTCLTKGNIIYAKGIKDIPVPHKAHILFSKLTMLHKFHFAFAHTGLSVFAAEIPKTKARSMPAYTCIFADLPKQPPRQSC